MSKQFLNLIVFISIPKKKRIIMAISIYNANYYVCIS